MDDLDRDFFYDRPEVAPLSDLLTWWRISAVMVAAAPHLHVAFAASESAAKGESGPQIGFDLIVMDPSGDVILRAGARNSAQVLRGAQRGNFSLGGVMEGGPEEIAGSILRSANVDWLEATYAWQGSAYTYLSAFFTVDRLARYPRHNLLESLMYASPTAIAIGVANHPALIPDPTRAEWPPFGEEPAILDIAAGTITSDAWQVPLAVTAQQMPDMVHLLRRAERQRPQVRRRR